jgi:hypothetical protein
MVITDGKALGQVCHQNSVLSSAHLILVMPPSMGLTCHYNT